MTDFIKKFSTITVIPNRGKDRGLRYTRRITRTLEQKGVRVTNTVTEATSLVIVVGGDGSILRAARSAAPLGIPILGINLGRIGYMAEVEVNEFSLLDRLFEGKYTVEERMMLAVAICRKGMVVGEPMNALNDAVISNGAVSRMVDVELFCDGNLAGHCRADGLIAATPTGSTAYSLSAGGAVVDPRLQCICVTPVCPQVLRAKPMIFAPDCLLEIHDTPRRIGEMYVTVDGYKNCRLERGDVVKITRSETVTKLVRLKEAGFYDVLNNKMSE